MPNTKSAKKALRGSLRKKEFNDLSKSKIKNSLRNLRKSLSEGITESQEALSKAFSALDKAVKTNLIPKGRANRKKSRLAALLERTFNTTTEAKPEKVAKEKVEKTEKVAKEVKPAKVAKVAKAK
jgi:small subunit ribosomal protein S20